MEKHNGICGNCLTYIDVPEMRWVTCPNCGAEVVAKAARERYFFDPKQGKIKEDTNGNNRLIYQ